MIYKDYPAVASYPALSGVFQYHEVLETTIAPFPASASDPSDLISTG